MGTAEIARRLGLPHRQKLHDWRKRYADFPQPIDQAAAGIHLTRTLVWRWVDVERWAKAHGKLP